MSAGLVKIINIWTFSCGCSCKRNKDTKKTRETPVVAETLIENHIDLTETPVLTLTCVSEEQVPVSSRSKIQT